MAKNPIVEFIKENLTLEPGLNGKPFFECKTFHGGQIRIFQEVTGSIILSVEDETRDVPSQSWILFGGKDGQQGS